MKTPTKAKGKKPNRWQAVAESEAREAYENNFPSRRGVHMCLAGDEVALCLYNNNPYANYPTLRDEETALFREWLKKNGIPEMAFATYPKTGESAGYTTAMIIEGQIERMDEVAAEMGRILELSMGRMAAAKPK